MRVTEIIGQMARYDSENVLGSAVDHYSALLNAAHLGMDPTAMAIRTKSMSRAGHARAAVRVFQDRQPYATITRLSIEFRPCGRRFRLLDEFAPARGHRCDS
jgi:hypothetical protein